MGGMADGGIDGALDELYAVAPEQFTARRTELAAAAKKRGDTAEAKRIGAARKPTAAAAVVNRLVHADTGVTARIGALGERLRAAHAEMDGEQIRLLSAEQRHLVAELSRAAFRAAEVANPSAALRDDVTATLQAAIADPDVTAQLGRLTKAEQWSGFGGFGDTTSVTSSTGKSPAKAPAKRKAPARAMVKEPPEDSAAQEAAKAERERRERARAVIAAAERAKAEADDALAERQTDLATARLRHDDARARLAKAEEALRVAEEAYDEAKRASREAGEVVRAARGRQG
jgi:hypothetical protein